MDPCRSVGDGGDASRRYLYTPVSITQADNECRLEGDKTHEIFHFLSKKVGGGHFLCGPHQAEKWGDASPRPTPIYARGCLKPTNTNSLPVLAGIAPSDIRRAVESRTERTRQDTDKRHSLNGHLAVVPRLKSRKSFMTCTMPINTTAKAARLELWRERLEPLDARVHLNISADEHLPAGTENPWTTRKALNRLRTQVGRSRVNMLKWGFSNEQETCDCGIRQTMQHLLVCPP